jgi:polyphenol oxidase
MMTSTSPTSSSRCGTPPRAHHLFTDRSGGVSGPPYDTLNLGDQVGDDPAAVAENRRRIAAGCDLPPDRLLFMRQVHGARVAVAGGPWPPGGPPAADGLVTARPATALAVLVADCVPVLLADAAAGVVGAAHAGRNGLALGVVPATLASMAALGARPDRVTAHVGPAVCGRCYEVPAALRDEVAAAVPEAHAVTRRGTPALDLPGGVAAQLRKNGVTQVEVARRCTMEEAQLFSHRRDGPATGRFAGLIWLAG